MSFLSRGEKVGLDSFPGKLTGQICPQIFTELKGKGDFERLSLRSFVLRGSPVSLIISVILVGRRQARRGPRDHDSGTRWPQQYVNQHMYK